MLHGVFRYVMPLLIVATFLTAVPVQAGPILDWLTGRHRQQWQVASVVDPCTTTMMVGTCAPTQMQQVVVGYAPQTRFRTAWHRVPVTQYRPVMAIDPCTGAQVTTMRPCVTYQWQVRRVPMRLFRPRFSTVPVVTAPAAPATVMSPTDCMACPTVPSATPYYSAPGAVISPGPATVMPSMPDATTVPAMPGVPNGVQPADTVPSLDPGQMQPPGIQSYYPPADAETRRAPEPNGTYSPDARQVPQGQGHRGVTAPANNTLLRPVPDPDAIQPPLQQRMPAGGPDPRDRTADRGLGRRLGRDIAPLAPVRDPGLVLVALGLDFYLSNGLVFVSGCCVRRSSNWAEPAE
jgi:hypothetical protein